MCLKSIRKCDSGPFYLSVDGLSLAKVIGTKFGDPVVTVAISRRSFLPSSAKEQIFKTLKKIFLNLAWILLKNRENENILIHHFDIQSWSKSRSGFIEPLL